MAGDWIKVCKETPFKPEVLVIATKLNIHPDIAFARCFQLWSWFDSNTKDGVTSGVTKITLDALLNRDGLCDALVSVGWLGENEEGNLYLPNFDRHNSETAKTRALGSKRQSKHRDKSNANGNATVTHEALPEKRREEKRETKPLSVKPDVIAILDYLNSKAGRSYKPVEANSKFILSRLNEGATVDDMKRVIDAKVSEWLNDATMNKYLRPATLFNAEKFAQYSGETYKKLPVGKFDVNEWLKAK